MLLELHVVIDFIVIDVTSEFYYFDITVWSRSAWLHKLCKSLIISLRPKWHQGK